MSICSASLEKIFYKIFVSISIVLVNMKCITISKLQFEFVMTAT